MVGVSLLFAVSSAFAADAQLTHTGRLLDSTGTPIDGSFDIELTLWPDSTSTDESAIVYREEVATVPVQEGYYAVVLGTQGGLSAESLADARFVEVKIADQTFGGRSPVTEVPRAAVALSVVGGVTDAPVDTPQTALPSSCKDILDADSERPSGLYFIDAGGTTGPVQTWCDMATDGGGWTLVSYAFLESGATHNSNRVHHSLKCGGGRWEPAERAGRAAAIDARALAASSTDIAFSIETTGGAIRLGDMSAYDTAYRFPIPDPAAVTFDSHGYRRNAFADVGPCVPVTVTQMIGGSGNVTRYTLTKSLGVSFTDSYPAGYGASNVASCELNTATQGPFVPSIHSGDGQRPHANNTGVSYAACDVESGRMTYAWNGQWTGGARNYTGASAIWLR